MLSQDVFKRCLLGLCKMNGVTAEDETLRMYYAKVREDFTDDEFREIANEILETENLYGKFPAPVLFYSRKRESEKKSEESDFIDARQKFQDKVMELVYNDYNPKEWVDELHKSLTTSENAALSALGGFSSLWASCRKNGVFDAEKADWTIRRIQEKFKENYNKQADERLRISDERNEEMALQIEHLASGAIKRMN